MTNSFETSFPRKKLLLGIGTGLILLIVSFASSARLGNQYVKGEVFMDWVDATQLKIKDAHEDMVLLARLAALSGSTSWENQFADSTTILNDSMQSMKKYSDYVTDQSLVDNFRKMESEMSAVFDVIFSNIRSGRLVESKSHAFSIEFEHANEDVVEALSQLQEHLAVKRSEQYESNRRAVIGIGIIWVMTFLVFCALFAVFYRLLSEWHSEVQSIHNRLENLLELKTQEVLSQQAELVSSNKLASLGEMASGIAHEINNPLGVLAGSIELTEMSLEDTQLESGQKEVFIKQLGKMSRMVERIGKIVKGLKVFSRNAEQDPPEWNRLDTMLENTFELCSEKVKGKGVEVHSESLENVKILCRESQLVQVFLNLIGNGSDAIQNIPEKWIRIESEFVGKAFRIHFTDSGPGIPEEVVKKLMTPFFTTKEVGKGTGLGLSISSKMIVALGGKFFYDADCKNTRFTIELPETIVERASDPQIRAA